MQYKADLCAQDVIFDSFILSDFVTFGKTVQETRLLLYLLDGIALLPALLLYNKLALNADHDLFEKVFDEANEQVFLAMVIASIGFVLRPLVVGELHINYYRPWLSEPNKLNFLALTVWMPAFAGIIILGLMTSASTNLEIPFTTCLQLFISVIAYWLLADVERKYVSEKMFSASIASFMPLSVNPYLTPKENKLSSRYTFHRTKV